MSFLRRPVPASAALLAALFFCGLPACQGQTGTRPAATAASATAAAATGASAAPDRALQPAPPVVGAAQLPAYLPLLKDKRVGLVVNHTSRIGNTHLLDTLLAHKVRVIRVFAPEHGFRGDADAGAHIASTTDARTGLPLASLYGKDKKPSPAMLQDLDLVIFDIQDVGARFYTYISTMHYVMEACAENKKQMLVLDRPNPNGSYVDGPVREPELKSFVSLDPIPVVHGLTVGELAKMINGEKWLANGVQCDLTVIPVKNYTHQTPYVLPVKPSPNLPSQRSVIFYPSLCMFEGTNVSVGRGTYTPFEIIGSPYYPDTSFSFVPKPIKGMDSTPMHAGKRCYGLDLRNAPIEPGFSLQYLLDFYQKTGKAATFFTQVKGFAQLAGTYALQKQIEAGMTEDQIRATWQPGLEQFKQQRKKYLLYKE